jgi:ribosomal protein uL22
MGKEKLQAKQEKAKEKFEEKAREKKEKELAEATGEKPKEKKKPAKKKVEIKKPVVDEAKSYAEYATVSPKVSVEVARAIRGKTIEKANKILDAIINLERPIRYYKYNKDVPHRRGKGFGAGRYPTRVAKVFKGLITNAVANAAYLNLDPEKLYIKTVIPNRAVSKEKQGRYTNITLTVAEIQEKEKVVKK